MIDHRRVALMVGFVTGFWLLHPFLVSTTLYTVQRMAMLPLTFMLVGLLLYTAGRVKYTNSQGTRGQFGLFAGVYLMTLLAMLCKENGIVFIGWWPCMKRLLFSAI